MLYDMHHGPLAQLVERFYGIEKVRSPNLLRSTSLPLSVDTSRDILFGGNTSGDISFNISTTLGDVPFSVSTSLVALLA